MITVYVLQGKAKRYVGITNNLERRLREHRNGGTQSAKIIGPFSLLHTEQYPTYLHARNREKYLKSGQGRDFLNQLYPRMGPACGG
jgi:putative endonuclease